MLSKRIILATFALVGVLVASAGVALVSNRQKGDRAFVSPIPSDHQEFYDSNSPSPTVRLDRKLQFVGVRENIPADAPTAYGFWSLAVPVPGVLSRSGQPLVTEFAWLKEQGWRSVVNLRRDGERGEVGDDMKLPGFSELGLRYVHFPITDGHPPTDEQAKQFLTFVTDPANQPVHVHCRGGFGRTGTIIALYRYAVSGWPMDQAIEESRAFKGGVSELQKKWLDSWAATHAPGKL